MFRVPLLYVTAWHCHVRTALRLELSDTHDNKSHRREDSGHARCELKDHVPHGLMALACLATRVLTPRPQYAMLATK